MIGSPVYHVTFVGEMANGQALEATMTGPSVPPLDRGDIFVLNTTSFKVTKKAVEIKQNINTMFMFYYGTQL